MTVQLRWLVLGLLILSVGALGADASHTRQLQPGEKSPPATIADIAWLQGHWRGEALGGNVEEMWTPPQHGVMLGMYRLIKDGKPVFYELLTFAEENGSLVLTLKHFEPSLTSWEEKNEARRFALVAKRNGALYFEGMTFMPNGKDASTVYVAIESGGSKREERFDYQRVSGAR